MKENTFYALNNKRWNDEGKERAKKSYRKKRNQVRRRKNSANKDKLCQIIHEFKSKIIIEL